MARLFRALARLCLGAIFVMSGIDQARNPAGRARKAAEELPSLPEPELVATVQGATMAVFGATLGVGLIPGISAAALAATLIPVTYVGHPFWKEEDPAARTSQRIHFLKNLSMFGGLLFVAADQTDHRKKHASGSVV